MENGYFVFFILLFVIIVFYYGYYYWPYVKVKKNINENWQNYKCGPYDEIKSGSNPLFFYNRPQYREPYRYPYKFHSDFLLPQAQYYENL